MLNSEPVKDCVCVAVSLECSSVCNSSAVISSTVRYSNGTGVGDTCSLSM